MRGAHKRKVNVLEKFGKRYDWTAEIGNVEWRGAIRNVEVHRTAGIGEN